MDRLGGTFGSHDAAEDAADWDARDVHDEDIGSEAPPSPVGQDERRMQVRAYNHWAGLLGDAAFPSIEDLDPASLDDFGPFSVLLDFSTGVEDPAVQYLGAKLAEECSAQESIERLSDVPSRSLLSRITDHYMQILANQAPIGFEAEFVNIRGNTALYRGILLPYSSDGEAIDFIYGVINWKEVADQQTADDLLLEIGQALEADYADDEDYYEELRDEVADLAASADYQGDEQMEKPFDRMIDEAGEEEDDVLDLGSEGEEIDAPSELPVPSFGTAADMSDGPKVPASMAPSVDAGLDDGWHDDEPMGETARDYGLDDDWEEPELDDVDDVVDPLADESVGIGLSALVSRGGRPRPMVELPSALDHAEEDAAPSVPQPYEPEETVAFERAPVTETPEVAHEEYEDFGSDPASEPAYEEEPVEAAEFVVSEEDAEEADDVLDLAEEAFVPAGDEEQEDAVAEDVFELDTPVELAEEAAPAPVAVEAVAPEAETGDAAEAPEGLYDCLAAARESAQMARLDEDRSRKALYDAVGRAYDFSIEAESAPEDFAELIADNGLTVQDRAPMTPIVKLVFGADYDKTRVTEYAAVLSHAHRLQIERGTLAGFLASAEGGLKGVVQAERRARKEEAGKPVEDENAVRESLAKKLRKLEPVAFEDLGSEGPEFALVMVRRTPEGELVIVGEVPEDLALVERAARKLVG